MKTKANFTMPKAVKDKWLKALRSGKYKQGQGMLRDDEGGYCCLGVLVQELDGKIPTTDGCSFSMPTMNFLKRHGIIVTGYAPYSDDFRGNRTVRIADSGCFEVFCGKPEESISLTELNDGSDIPRRDPYTFEQIADIIEEQVEGY